MEEGSQEQKYKYESDGPYPFQKVAFPSVSLPNCGRYNSITLEAFIPAPVSQPPRGPAKPSEPFEDISKEEAARKDSDPSEGDLKEEAARKDSKEVAESSFPVATFSTGYALKPDLYSSYGASLASHGYVALVWAPVVEDPISWTGPRGPTHKERGLLNKGLVDWAAAESARAESPLHKAVELSPLRVFTAGHSLGGKTAVLCAAYDDRVKGVMGIGPVDAGRPYGNPEDDPSSTDLLKKLSIPSAFIGCDPLNAFKRFFFKKQYVEPPDCNYQVFYNSAQGELSWEVMVKGSGHLAFKDRPGNPLFEATCKKGTVSYQEAGRIAKTVMVSMAEHSVRGVPILDQYVKAWSAENAGKIDSCFKQSPVPPVDGREPAGPTVAAASDADYVVVGAAL